jgi:uncharacterized membrane protein YeaQ/YmgE (transglycosylase-associated protein family)
VLILALVVFGFFVGWLAQLIIGRGGSRIDWMQSLVAGLVGSFLGGLIISLISGDGLSIRPSGLLGSIGGAIIVLLIWNAVRRSSHQKQSAAALKAKRSGRHH